ncbi:MAG TPA: PhzF family phenazine biosynthesis protein [Thermomonospora sp.]|nr:PhzF family phenazine biosynthesis protein [Thermomonospora sp.]
MITYLARVFVAPDGRHGNPVAVVLGDLPDRPERQRIAARSPAPATVFVAPDGRSVRIHNRKLERPFAGHPLLGTAAVLRHLGTPADTLETPAGTVPLWHDHGTEWLQAPSRWSPPVTHRRLTTPADVEALTEAPPDEPVQVWAWIDETSGTVRARQFAPSEGKPEDEACGSATMVLATLLGRPLTVHHGRGSLIHAHPHGTAVNLGGLCTITRPRP